MLAKKQRVLLLSIILLFVIMQQLRSHWHTTDWDQPLWVVIYPINGDGRDATSRYIQNLSAENFDPIETFFTEQGKRHGLALNQPVEIELAPPITNQPPKLPPRASWFERLSWSLKIRFWAGDNDSYESASPDIRIYVLYFDPKITQRLPHSVGLEKAKLGLVHAFASTRLQGQNQVVISHELLHTVGATDKYDLATNLPLFPDGYAAPSQQPRYPQGQAELMGGRIPKSEREADIPKSLKKVMIGELTAQEINWR